jgi:signal transduction histidine kinase
MVGSGIAVTGLYTNGLVSLEILPLTFFQSWISHITGILLFTPVVLAVVRLRIVAFNIEKAIEAAIFIASMTGLYLLVSYGYFNATLINSLPYLLIPFLLWLAFRFELTSAISVSLIASMLAIHFTIQQVGPFIQSNSADSLLLLQIFICVISISTIVLSATVAERVNAQEKLKQFNQNLEKRIEDRTHALNEEINIRKRAEDKLLRTNTELNKRNTELDNFVYSVSHDLRAPIASVLGLINLAREDRDPAMQQIYLDKINQSAIQQDNFIREILDHSRNSRLEVKKEEIQFKPLIEETFDQLKLASEDSVEKIITIKQNGSFFSDRWRLKVVLNNIISNSIRYRNGRDPVIKVNVDITDNKAQIAIEDNGRGIADEHLNRVCQMFYRATDQGAGSGLGLYIVKETIDKLQGSIQIQSKIGKGTTIRLEIPALQ